MIQYNYDNIDRVLFVGDIHGEFLELFNIIKYGISSNNKRKRKGEQQGYNNSIIIVAGDCGFGFNKLTYYEQIFSDFEKLLEASNTHVIFVRGNHDDPSYFSEKKIDLPNIKCVPDYSIISTKSKNVLCIGGGISVDRIWRKQKEVRINRFRTNEESKKKLYWENEPIVEDLEAINEIIKNKIKIDAIVTHSAPDFAYPYAKDTSLSWFRVDDKLKEDIEQERTALSNIFHLLEEKEALPFIWVYGHFHKNWEEFHKGTFFRLLSDDIRIMDVFDIANRRKREQEERESIIAKDKFTFDEWFFNHVVSSVEENKIVKIDDNSNDDESLDVEVFDEEVIF